MDCIFCKIVKGEIPSYKVWENDNFLVLLDIMPLNPGHLLIIPKEHSEEIYDMKDELLSEAFIVAKKLSTNLKNITEAKKIGLVVEGFGVAHSHIHLVPLNKGSEINPERAQKANTEELLEMQSKLLEAFKDIK